MKKRVIRITITTEDGEVLDQFPVRHWRDDSDDNNEENVGSHASESLLAARISRCVATKAGRA